ncbi:MAG: DciA family protein, partial [Sphingomonas sp.]
MGGAMTERRPRRPARTPDAPPARSLRARSVGDMLPSVGGASFRRFGFVQAAVVSRWGEIVGERFAAVSAPESIRFPAGTKADGVLTLIVEGAFGTTIQHVAPAIVERVNRFFGYGAVARVAIRQGNVARPAPRRMAPSLRPIPQEMGESVRDIADPELRACLESLARAVADSTGTPVLSGPMVGLP